MAVFDVFSDVDELAYCREFAMLGVSEDCLRELASGQPTEHLVTAKWLREAAIELVTVLSGEYNLLVGKLRPEYQNLVSMKTTLNAPV